MFTLGAWAWCPRMVLTGHYCEHTLFQEPKLLVSFGLGASARVYLGTKVGIRSHILVLGQSTAALYSLLSSCFKMALDRAKCSNYLHSHILGTVNTTPLFLCHFCWHPGTGSQEPSVDSLVPKYFSTWLLF